MGPTAMEPTEFAYRWALELWNDSNWPTIWPGMAKSQPAAEVPPPLGRGLNLTFSTVFGPKAMELFKFEKIIGPWSYGIM